jgi:hypothetical protein
MYVTLVTDQMQCPVRYAGQIGSPVVSYIQVLEVKVFRHEVAD